jgi:hypothetical protein
MKRALSSADTTVRWVRFIILCPSCDQCLIFGRYPVEYLHLPAPRTQYASEYGHLLRIASLHGRLEAALNATDGKPFPITYARVELLISLPRRSRSPA